MVRSQLIKKMCDLHPGVFRRDMEKILDLIDKEWQVNPYKFHVETTKQFLKETNEVIKILREGDIENLKKAIQNFQILFKGSCGLGMNWYIGHNVL